MPGEFAFDVFLSHSTKDKAVVRELAARLKQDGVRAWLDEEQIKPGDCDALSGLMTLICRTQDDALGWLVDGLWPSAAVSAGLFGLFEAKDRIEHRIVGPGVGYSMAGSTPFQANGLRQASPGQARNERRPGYAMTEMHKP